MKWTLAVDPGLRACGCSLFEQDTLYRAWLSRNPIKAERGPKAWERMAAAVLNDLIRYAPQRSRLVNTLVIEVPQIYWGAKKGGRAADLIEVAGVVGSVAAAVPVLDRIHYLPREWKGTVPKEIHNKRVVKRLRVEEDARIVRPSATLLHNVIDSIGLGFKQVGRFP